MSDVLKKLQEKNEAQRLESKRIAKNDRMEFIGIALVVAPLLFSYAYRIYCSFMGFEVEYSILFMFLGSISFGLPAIFLIDFQLFYPQLKLAVLSICIIWFSYFWVVVYLSWLAYIPLLILYAWLLKNRKEISKQLNREAGI